MSEREEPAGRWWRLGAALDGAGQVGLPVAIGMAFGYWVGDQGTPWLPDMLEGVLGLLIVSVAAVLLGKKLRGRLHKETAEGRRLRRRVLTLMAVAIAAVTVRLGVHLAERPSRLTSLPQEDLEAAFAIDEERYDDYDRGMAGVLDRLERAPFVGGPRDGALSADDEALLLDAWRSMLDFAWSLDELRIFYEDWYRCTPGRWPPGTTRSGGSTSCSSTTPTRTPGPRSQPPRARFCHHATARSCSDRGSLDSLGGTGHAGDRTRTRLRVGEEEA